MRAVKIEPGKYPVEIELSDGTDAERARELRELVRGYIETVPVAFGALGIVNEEGKLLGLEGNLIATAIAPAGETIVGTMVVVGWPEGDDFTAVPDDVAERLTGLGSNE